MVDCPSCGNVIGNGINVCPMCSKNLTELRDDLISEVTNNERLKQLYQNVVLNKQQISDELQQKLDHLKSLNIQPGTELNNPQSPQNPNSQSPQGPQQPNSQNPQSKSDTAAESPTADSAAGAPTADLNDLFSQKKYDALNITYLALNSLFQANLMASQGKKAPIELLIALGLERNGYISTKLSVKQNELLSGVNSEVLLDEEIKQKSLMNYGSSFINSVNNDTIKTQTWNESMKQALSDISTPGVYELILNQVKTHYNGTKPEALEAYMTARLSQEVGGGQNIKQLFHALTSNDLGTKIMNLAEVSA